MILASALLAMIRCDALIHMRVLPSDGRGNFSTLFHLQYNGRMAIVTTSFMWFVLVLSYDVLCVVLYAERKLTGGNMSLLFSTSG